MAFRPTEGEQSEQSSTSSAREMSFAEEDRGEQLGVGERMESEERKMEMEG